MLLEERFSKITLFSIRKELGKSLLESAILIDRKHDNWK